MGRVWRNRFLIKNLFFEKEKGKANHKISIFIKYGLILFSLFCNERSETTAFQHPQFIFFKNSIFMRIELLNRQSGQKWSAVFSFLLFTASLFAQDYQKAWEAIGKNDRKQGRILLEKALKNPATTADAALSLLRLDGYDGAEAAATARKYQEQALAQLADPYPYMYAWWFNAAMAGDYGLKDKEQLKFLEKLLEDPNANGSIKASSQYHLGHHFVQKKDFKKAMAAWGSISNVKQWQFTGPFDNISESGFDKNWPPIENPKPDAKFTATNNAEIRWFTPSHLDNDGWVKPAYHIRWNSGVLFAQTFVSSSADVAGILGLGFSGSVKVWINDRLLFSEEEARVTDVDVYRVPMKLKKGLNRILVQLSFVDSDYPNFSLRLTDEKGNLLPDLTSSTKYGPYPKDTETKQPTVLPHFAEQFFENKIKSEPDNLLNYILLCETYLRSRKSEEALKTVDLALAKAPDCGVLRFEKLWALSKLENRTELTKEIEWFKINDAESQVGIQYRFDEEFDNEKWDDAEKILDRRIQLYGEDEETYGQRVKLASKRDNLEETLKWANKGFDKYPTNLYFVGLQHNIAINLRKDPEEAIGIWNQFLKKKYVVSTAIQVASEYFELGKGNRGVVILEELAEAFPNDVDLPNRLFNYYYGQKENKTAKIWAERLIGLAPFHSSYFEIAAKLSEQAGSSADALANYRKALHYNPNDFDTRRKIRELEKKTDLVTLFPKSDPYELLKNTNTDGKEGEYDWYYVLDEQQTIVYPERTSEMYVNLAIKILNEKGIEYWKEASINYNSSRQRLIIEKAEIVKANGSKITAEQNENQLVFPNLEKGDGIYFRYRVMSYAYGRMAREFWDNFGFNTSVPTDLSRYTLLMPKSIKFEYKSMNSEIKPEVKNAGVDDYEIYTWQSENEAAIKDERFTPAGVDIAKYLTISTLPSWNEVMTWYGDISATQAKRDYEVVALAKTLFPEGEKISETEKAKRIYNWIVQNIKYSSVSFRQSGYVPQRASKVIQTKLGDCKDLSTLFAALAREVGLKANLVLINTRENGLNSLQLPSMEFNHCIIKVTADGKFWYLELTDAHLPFGSLPTSDNNALALEIPFGLASGEAAGSAKVFQLAPQNRTPNVRLTFTKVELLKKDLVVKVHATRGGAPTGSLRGFYGELPQAKRIEKIQEAISKDFTNPVSVKNVIFTDLKTLKDTIQYDVHYQVKNEVMEIGSLQTFKIPYFNTFVNASAFTEETRTLPLSYWEYEDNDEYADEITVELPAGKAFTEIPTDAALNFKGFKYSLKFQKAAAGTLKINRKITVQREDVPAAEYPKFKEFMDEIVAAESKFVAYK